ncbi:hypothetical protein, variant [Aphanomyces invadans]|uniref:Coronin n=1 Tax=Aphanomyces invadans TaxID=157072 RepID=A0A024U282_9STRA|nr:hypothetical protein, variant [Aphanomyces invadans]ETV99986.1 hypothetical protein, variant [Aphanomyces invadans]|eukprot:XP_008871403.1 hypothetical protein, variant [Aphanomyces invadans]
MQVEHLALLPPCSHHCWIDSCGLFQGDKIIRTYEINVDKAPAFSPLQATTSSRPAWGVARVPKRACALTSCEVARLLVVEQGNVIEPISYTVPRRDAVNQFQADLYPDSRTSTPALTAADWASRRDAAPLLGAVVPAASGTAGAALHGAIDVANTSWNAGGGWASAAPPPTAILTPDIDAPATQAAPIKFELSEKAKKLGSIQGNKFKYITGKTMARSESFLNVPSSDAALLVANATHWATAIVGTGGPVLVHPLGSPGKVDHGGIVINCHKLPVTDLEFHPFRPQLLATASDDCSIQLSDYTNPNERVVASLSGHDKGIRCVAFHPSANNVLASGAMDCTIRLWDVGAQTARQVIQKFDDAPWNVSFNFDGTLLATISRDKVLRVIDPRANRTAAMACAHDGAKAQKVLWCAQHLSSSTLVTVGFTARSERQVFLWDARNLLDPVCQTTLDTSGSALLPFYDESANVIYLVSRGDRTVMTYEIDAAAGTVAPCAPFAFTGAPIAGAALLPKQSCNVRDVEVAKFLLLTKATIEPVTLSVPRADKLKPFFQDDIYGVVRTYSTGVSPDAWFRGHDRAPSTESLNRSGMPLLSAREQDVVVAVPNVIEFQAQKDREDHARAVRDQQIQRLHALAAQPTLHHQGAAVHPDDDDDDDDDGWDD